ncbi:MAG: hypothetical protein LBN93_07110 [Candidatus Symbiothrix sp.]|jgi:hypothetical protein|nr:hypothetical protein [Candidatus Symbiothrix sp.]
MVADGGGKPTKVALIEVPANTTLRKSVAGSQKWDLGSGSTLDQIGGGIQYEIISPHKAEWFETVFDDVNKLFD